MKKKEDWNIIFKDRKPIQCKKDDFEKVFFNLFHSEYLAVYFLLLKESGKRLVGLCLSYI